MTKPSTDELFEALASLKPETERTTQSEYIGRRETVLRRVLHRAASGDAAPASAARKRRRAVMAGGLAVALVGGGAAAWAGGPQFARWYFEGGASGVTCTTTWQGIADNAPRPDKYGGLSMSFDPIADCHRYAELTGKPRIEDPVAVRLWDTLFVGPREGMPSDAVPDSEWRRPEVSPAPPRVIRDQVKEWELDNSLADVVDGGSSRCWTPESGAAFARAELGRLGFTDWQVTTRADPEPLDDCAFMAAFVPGTVEVVPQHTNDPSSVPPGDLSIKLREQVASACLPLDEAAKVVDDLLQEESHYEPTWIQRDPEASCTRVDLVRGGSQQVFLYGP
ncbi:MAG: hypothetical protein QM708_01335 [Propioniciclava sp.]|uniref:hypothetical protein n=1 Tax=Propioniciclava sp. TaxID=2038686 RepID=UPI0039E684F2